MPHVRRIPLALLWCAIAAGAARGQGVTYIKEHYTKHEYRVPMRDGVDLFTIVYQPRDGSRTYPILLQRTPYSVAPYGRDEYDNDIGPSPLFGKAGYIVAYQDVRGCFMSGGTFEDVRPIDHEQGKTDESTDTYDTVEWLLKTIPDHNGRVGLWGISYPAFYAAAGLVDAHPAVKAVSPQAPLVDWFMGDDTHHNGALFLNQEFNFDASFGLSRPEPTTHGHPPFQHGTDDAYAFFLNMGPLPEANAKHLHGERAFWNQVMEHGTYDEFWKRRNLLPHLTDVRPAVLTVGGWFDAENLYGSLHVYRQIESHSPPESPNILVMGPWSHGGWAGGDGSSLGPLRFGSGTAEFYRESIEFPFFEHYLKDGGDWDPPEAWVFETGGNLWRRHDAWPPKEAAEASIYLQPEGGLSFSEPEDDAAPFDEYTSDPARPVPYTAMRAIDTPREYMVEDQRFAARRPDVLVYQTEPLTEDVTLAGPIGVELHVTTTGTDSDWVIKLIDAYSDIDPRFRSRPGAEAGAGFQQLVRGDVMRGKFRRSFEEPVPFVPGEPTVVPFELQDVYHTFRAGHRIMVQVQSSWFPLVDRNPQTFVDIYHAKPADFVQATQRVYHTPDRPSRLTVRRMPKKG